MFVTQVSVYIENRTGRLEELLRLLGENGVDLIALSMADTTDFGILRLILNNNEKAQQLLRQNGYTAKLTEVLAVAVPDAPGGLAGVLVLLRAAGIGIEYLYSLVRRVNGNAVIVFRVDEPEKAAELLAQKGVQLLNEAQILEG